MTSKISIPQFSLILAAFALIPLSAKAEDTRLFELRTYHTNEGKLDELHTRFRDHTVALFEKHGMTNVGYWVPAENEKQVLIYLLAYPDKEAHAKSWKAFRADPVWKKAYAASTKNGKLIKKVDNVFLNPTDYSPELDIAKENPERLFELRQYTTNEGKLENLDARFRDHTVELFTKHGLVNLPYFHIAKGQEGAGRTLVYFLAHQDQASRDANFKAFGSDPEWKSARADSEKDGKILIKGGVQSTMLVPTDYSPMK